MKDHPVLDLLCIPCLQNCLGIFYLQQLYREWILEAGQEVYFIKPGTRKIQ